ncbi:hypothetical protein BGZ60DRAFT_528933 [Tricladium varicosporioides]|nr:hypothetical protein BGZ60DRAFT_528933 [Hymenoscyphus varicosporioides]
MAKYTMLRSEESLENNGVEPLTESTQNSQNSSLSSLSTWAGLVNDISIPYLWDSPWNSPNASERNKLWYDDESSDKGIVALDNDEVKAMGLPASQPFPWDSKKKSLFLLNGHHNLHCLRNLYIAINEYHTDCRISDDSKRHVE